MNFKVKDIARALNDLTGGRCDKQDAGNSRFFVTKSSGIDGKSVLETPGLVYGDPEMDVGNAVALAITANEGVIEFMAHKGIKVLITLHPVADAASSGGVPLKTYLDLYGIALFEAHEAFHGLHPGISFLHGHKPFYTNTNFGGIPGCVVHVGDALRPEVKTVGNMVDRINRYMNLEQEKRVLAALRSIYGTNKIQNAGVSLKSRIILGDRDRAVNKVLHIFPHTGFSAAHLKSVKKDNPKIDTMLASISRVYPGNELIDQAQDMDLNFIAGNSHINETSENWIPLGYALQKRLPGLEVVVFQDRITSTPLERFGSKKIRDYGKTMADDYLGGKIT